MNDGCAVVGVDDVTGRAAIAPLGAAVLWGGLYVVSKWTFDAVAPLTLGFVRVTLGALALLAFVGVRRDALREWRRFCLLGLWVALSIATQFVGTDLTTAGQGSLLTVLSPVFTVAFGVVLLDESLSRATIVGTVLAIVGTLVVVAGQYDLAALTGGSLLGIGALVVASVTWAAFTVQGAPLVRRYGALTTATYATVASVPMLAVLAGWEVATVGLRFATDPVVLGAVAYLAFAATAAAWVLWYKGLEVADSGAVAVAFFAQPLVGTALGALVLDETVGPLFFVGGVVMCAGILVVERAG